MVKKLIPPLLPNKKKKKNSIATIFYSFSPRFETQAILNY